MIVIMRGVTKYTLKKATEHIFYESWMFYQTLIALTKSKNQVEINILLDAFSIHARNLFDFFYPKKHAKDDDILVYDYVNNGRKFDIAKTKKRDLRFIVRKADKQVAHLTYSRNRYNSKTKPWPFIEIGRKMHKTLKSFYDNLPDSYRKWDYVVRLKRVIDENSNMRN